MILGQKGRFNNQRQRRWNNDQRDEKIGTGNPRVRKHNGPYAQFWHNIQGNGLDDTNEQSKRNECVVQEGVQTDEKETEDVHVREGENWHETWDKDKEAGVHDEAGYKNRGCDANSEPSL